VVGRVIDTGHEPRRFVEDLLERLRDLIVLAASGQAGAQALAEIPEDQRERMIDQSRRLGLARASRAGDTVNDALTALVGATSPRLHLELLCARLIAADTAPTPVGAVSAAAGPAAAGPAAVGPAVAAPAAAGPAVAVPVASPRGEDGPSAPKARISATSDAPRADLDAARAAVAAAREEATTQ